MQPGRVCLTSVGGAFAARVLEARLASEGITCELRGTLDGLYPVTVGEGARVDVYVPLDQLADARYVMLADEIDAVFDEPEGRDATAPAPRSAPRWIALFAVAALVLVPLLRAAAWAV